MRSPSSILVAASLVILAVLFASPATAQQTTRSQKDPRPVAHAAPRKGSSVVGGELDDAGWTGATPITELTQMVADDGKPASQRTELRLVYDEAAIYVAARMYDTLGARGVKAVLARRDQLLDGSNGLTSDKISLVFDTYRDKNGRTWFELNPLGVKGDHKDGDASYDPVWEGASNIDSLGWTAEFRIPYSQLRFSRDTLQTWGMQVWRNVDRRNEQDMWAFWRMNEYGGAAYFGSLEGIVVPSPPRTVEAV